MGKSLAARHGLEVFFTEHASQDDNTQTTVYVKAGVGHINLRADCADASCLSAIEVALGQAIPQGANTYTEHASIRIIWLGPDEWQITLPLAQVEATIETLRRAIGNARASVCDISAGQVSLDLRGDRVNDVLSQGCTLDFEGDQFGSGRCAQSALAKASAIFVSVGDDHVELIVRRSFAEYVMLWLEHAGAEHGIGFAVD